jgi:hypothetical protein
MTDRTHDLAKAFNYILKRWASFTLFLEDGRVCLSNNAAERGLRGIALGLIAEGGAPQRVQLDRHSQNEWRRSARLAGPCPCSHRPPPSSSAGRGSALELDDGISDLRSSGMPTHVNKVHHVTTITQVAKDLGEDDDRLRDISIDPGLLKQ